MCGRRRESTSTSRHAGASPPRNRRPHPRPRRAVLRARRAAPLPHNIDSERPDRPWCAGMITDPADSRWRVLARSSAPRVRWSRSAAATAPSLSRSVVPGARARPLPQPRGCHRWPTVAPPHPCQPARRLRRCAPSSRGAFESSTPTRLAMFLELGEAHVVINPLRPARAMLAHGGDAHGDTAHGDDAPRRAFAAARHRVTPSSCGCSEQGHGWASRGAPPTRRAACVGTTHRPRVMQCQRRGSEHIPAALLRAVAWALWRSSRQRRGIDERSPILPPMAGRCP